MISDQLVGILRCPTCRDIDSAAVPNECYSQSPHVPLEAEPSRCRLACPMCGSIYPMDHGYVEALPQKGDWAVSKYSTDDFEAQLDYRDIGPPVLAAGVRQRQLEKMLPLSANDTVIDLGCGNGKFAVWNQRRCGHYVAIDGASLFADKAKQVVDLVQADARLLPFGSNTFTRAISIDVLEHFAAEDVDRYLSEACRVLRPGGLLFVYSNTRERGRYKRVIDFERRISSALAGMDLIDIKTDMLRKSDHVKSIVTLEDLEEVTNRAGFHMREIVYWNGIIQSMVENIVAKLAEGLAKRIKVLRSGSQLSDSTDNRNEVRRDFRKSIGRSKKAMFVMRSLTNLMYLDIKLWGGSRTGPFFAVFEKVESKSNCR